MIPVVCSDVTCALYPANILRDVPGLSVQSCVFQDVICAVRHSDFLTQTVAFFPCQRDTFSVTHQCKRCQPTLQVTSRLIVVRFVVQAISNTTQNTTAQHAVPFCLLLQVVGPILGPLLGGVLSQQYGWRSTFICLVVLCGGLVAPLLALLVPETQQFRVIQKHVKADPAAAKLIVGELHTRRLRTTSVSCSFCTMKCMHLA